MAKLLQYVLVNFIVSEWFKNMKAQDGSLISNYKEEKQQMLTEVTGGLMAYNYRNSFMGGLPDILDESEKSSSIDILERLKLVKSNMDLVVRLAAWHAVEAKKPFLQMLKVGISSVVKSARMFRGHHTEFGEYLKNEISDAMLKFSKL